MSRQPRELVTLTRAAALVDRHRRTLDTWVARDLLFPVGLAVDGKQLFDLADVRRLDSATPRRRRRARKPRRREGT